jgi:uncharacterized protein (TIGR02145 family)
MRAKTAIYLVLLPVLLLMLNLNCKKETIKTAPTVAVSAATNITAISASAGGDITADGGAEITAKGICWSTNQNPTTSDSKTSNGSGAGSFTCSITGLTPGATYNIRAYAINSVGTGYSSQRTFTTLALAPVLTTTDLSAITATTATSGGNITNDGGSSITARGVCWSKSQNPTTADAKTTDGSGSGSFTSAIMGLTPATIYYFRAYATNSIGTAYGNQVMATSTATLSTLTTAVVSAITSSTATSGGNIASDGGAAITARGICWSASSNPTIQNSKTTDGTGTGSFTSSITGLTPGATYYVKAYATNSIGTAYGNEFTITATAISPVLITGSISNITATTAMSGGNITTDGGSPVTARGVCWSASSNPTTANSKTNDGAGTGSFTSSITSLTPGATYYVRAYATNSIGTAYGNEFTITATAILPVLTTGSISNITATTAVSGGNITTDGGSPVTVRGVCWSTSSNPTILNSKTNDGAGTGSFTSSITSLTPGATYYVKAYATNNLGTGYGNQVSFSTTDYPNCGTVTDIDGNVYKTVTIGSQCWLRENLKTTKYNDGTAIPMVTDNTVWSNLSTPGYCWYNNDAVTNKSTYGALYNWYTVNTGKLCPTGWHIPADAEWTVLTTYLGGESVAGGKLKETGTSHWLSPNTGATNTTGFTAVPGSYRYFNGTFFNFGIFGYWWSSTEVTSTEAMYHVMRNDDTVAQSVYNYKQDGISVRCVKGESTVVNQAPQQPTAPNPVNNATGISLSTTLSWTCSDPENDPLTYDVYFGTSPNPTTKVSADQTANSYSPTNLTAGTDYYWKIVAKDNKNNSNTSPVWKFATAVAVQYPTVTTTSVTSITTTTSVSGGSISSDGGASVIARGVCWSTSQNPTIAGTKTTDGIGTGSFTSAITGLAPNTTYYVRSYTINNVGTAYGSQVSFTTSVQAQLPTLTTIAASAISTTSATSGGSISSDGGATVTARGVCWSTSPSPTTSNSKTTNGAGIGSFTSSLTGLTAGTIYYVRAYATNSAGTSYGNEISFTTFKVYQLEYISGGNQSYFGGGMPLPMVFKIKNITDNVYITNLEAEGLSLKATADIGYQDLEFNNGGNYCGNVDNRCFGGYYFVDIWHGNDYTLNIKVTLSKNNQVVSTYPIIENFKNNPAPTVITASISDITSTSATVGGNVTVDGGTAVYERGIYWSTSPNLEGWKGTKIQIGSGTGLFSTSLSGLSPNTLYYIRAYAINSGGTAYGSQVSFVTTNTIANGSISDLDGNIYSTVIIGTQVWMTSNLKTTKYNDGTSILNVTDNTAWGNLATPGYCWYNNDAATNKNVYGALYNWFTVNTGKLCPTGWHVPSDTEWTVLTNFLGGESVAGGKLKETGTIHWSPPNAGATNETGFTALSGGWRDGASGGFDGIGNYGAWLTSTFKGNPWNFFPLMSYNSSSVIISGVSGSKQNGFSVRCLHD